MSKPKVNVLEIFRELESCRIERLDLEKQAKELASRESLLKSVLLEEVPAGQIIHGVEHRVTLKPSVTYTAVVADLTELLPKAKQSMVPDIIKAHTATTQVHTFKEI